MSVLTPVKSWYNAKTAKSIMQLFRRRVVHVS